MMKMPGHGVISLVAMALAAAPVLAVEASTAPLEPNGPWVVEASEGACILTRSYGPDESKITIGIQPLFALPKTEVIVLTHDSSAGWDSGDATVTLSGGSPLSGRFTSYPLTNNRRLTRLAMPSELLAQVKSASSLTFTTKSQTATVHLVRTAAAFAAFDQCQAALFKLWKVDGAALAPDRTPVGLNVESAYGPDDYPLEAQRRDIQGRVVVVVDVTATGAVSGCRVVAPVHPVLDEATCRRTKRLRFVPGKDAAGNAAAAPYILPVRWLLPRG